MSAAGTINQGAPTGAPAIHRARRIRTTTGPGPSNYAINIVTFSVVRESPTTDRATASSPADVAALARTLIPDDAREHFLALLLDAQNRLVATHEVSSGTLSASLVHPREVFGPALRIMGVSALILVHNHPSGDPTPSREDIRLTHQLAEAGRLLDLRVHDHVILGNGTGRYVSLAERGLMP